MKTRILPKMLIIDPQLMIHDYGLKGVDLLLFAYISSVYQVTAKAVTFSRSYIADMLCCSRRQVINSLHKLVEAGVLANFNETYIPAYAMTKGWCVKKVHTPVKKVHTMNISMNIEIEKKNNNSFIRDRLIEKNFKELKRIIDTSWLED